MATKRDYETYTESNKESEVFTFLEKENENQFLSENFVFNSEENLSQTGTDLNNNDIGLEDNKTKEESLEVDEEDNNRDQDELNKSINETNVSTTTTTTTTTATTTATTTSSVISTVAATATAAVVLVAGTGMALGETDAKPAICVMEEIAAVENTIVFQLAIGDSEELIYSDEQGQECNISVELTSIEDKNVYKEYVVTNYGVIMGEFTDLKYDTEYIINVAANTFLGTVKDYLLDEPIKLRTEKAKQGEGDTLEYFEITPNDITLDLNDDPVTISITTYPENAKIEDEIVWSVSSPEALSIEPIEDGLTCLLIPMGSGNTTLSVTIGNLYNEANVHVTDNGGSTETTETTEDTGDTGDITDTSEETTDTGDILYDFTLSTGEVSIGLSDSPITISIETNPVNYVLDPTQIIWVNEDPSIVTMEISYDKYSVQLTPLSAGLTTIIVSYGGFNASCFVSVDEDYGGVESITFDEESVNMAVGETLRLYPTVTPSDASREYLSWSSSDETIATVDAYGNVTGVGEGETTITYGTSDGVISASVTVTTHIAEPTFSNIFINLNTTNSGNEFLSFTLGYEDVSKVWNDSFVLQVIDGSNNNQVAFEGNLRKTDEYSPFVSGRFLLEEQSEELLAMLKNSASGQYKCYIYPESEENRIIDNALGSRTFYGSFTNGVSPLPGSISIETPYHDEEYNKYYIQFSLASTTLLQKFDSADVVFTNTSNAQETIIESVALGETIRTSIALDRDDNSFIVQTRGKIGNDYYYLIEETISAWKLQ